MQKVGEFSGKEKNECRNLSRGMRFSLYNPLLNLFLAIILWMILSGASGEDFASFVLIQLLVMFGFPVALLLNIIGVIYLINKSYYNNLKTTQIAITINLISIILTSILMYVFFKGLVSY